MKKIIGAALLVMMTAGGCGMNGNEDGPEDINYEPARYERTDMNELPEEQRFRNNREHQDIDEMRRDYERDVRRSGERDTPFNMDEEEPDLDEEPSEQRREMD